MCSPSTGRNVDFEYEMAFTVADVSIRGIHWRDFQLMAKFLKYQTKT